MAKRRGSKTLPGGPKKPITSKQRAARRRNIKVARESKKRAMGVLSEKIQKRSKRLFPKGKLLQNKKKADSLDRRIAAMKHGYRKLAGPPKRSKRRPMYVHYD